MNTTERCWAVVPAAGVGARMGAGRPKQYLDLLGEPILVHTVRRLATHARIDGVVLALATADPYFEAVRPALAGLDWARTDGGEERCHSVLNGLRALARRARPDDWVLVHDAARPCLRAADIDALVDAVLAGTDGGLLVVPVADTVKHVDARGRVTRTVPREGLVRAQTPQMFRVGQLRDALSAALAAGQVVTDEASAMELAGFLPVAVEGHGDNIKVTRREDLELAALYLRAQGNGA